MRELDRDQRPISERAPAPEASQSAGGNTADRLPSVAVVGNGRAGKTFALGLTAAGYPVTGPLGRGTTLDAQVDIALLCVPDSSITDVASEIAPTVLVGHCSGASGPQIFGRRAALSIHPLMTLAGDPAAFEGAWAAVDGTDRHSLEQATQIAETLGMNPFRISPEDRTAYHAAASIASNFLITLQASAQQLADATGMPAGALLPLVKATVENWEQDGPDALTGPIARGDTETVELQRAAITERAPELLDLFDVLCAHTAQIVGRRETGSGVTQ